MIDADSALQVNATLEVGQTNEVSVSTAEEVAEVHVETVATQLGEVVSDIEDDESFFEWAQLYRSCLRSSRALRQSRR